jgi:hypothetical protein
MINQVEMKNQTDSEAIRTRIIKLGLHCPDELRFDVKQVPINALICMPMLYVAVTHELNKDEEVKESLINDIFGVHSLSGSRVIEDQTETLTLNPVDESHLRSLLINRRDVDGIIYEYAIETIRQFLTKCDPHVAHEVRVFIATTMKSIVDSTASGTFGLGRKPSAEQIRVVRQVSDKLDLYVDEEARVQLDELEIAIA